MIFQLSHPAVFLGMALGFVAAVLLHNLAQAVAGRALGDPVTRMARRRLIDPKREFEPFGIIAMIIAGLGWGRPVELAEPRTRGGRKRRYITALLAGPLAAALLGVVLLVAYAVLSGDKTIDLPGGATVAAGPTFGAEVLGTAGVTAISIAALYLIPLPPLDGVRIMWALAPPTLGWQKARYYLEEQNYGLGALVILSLPLFSGQGLITRIAYAIAEPLISAVVKATGGG